MKWKRGLEGRRRREREIKGGKTKKGKRETVRRRESEEKVRRGEREEKVRREEREEKVRRGERGEKGRSRNSLKGKS